MLVSSLQFSNHSTVTKLSIKRTLAKINKVPSLPFSNHCTVTKLPFSNHFTVTKFYILVSCPS